MLSIFNTFKTSSPSIPPIVYSYIQKKYWKVIMFTFTGQRSIPSIIYMLPLFCLLTIGFKYLHKSYKQNTREKPTFIFKFLDILRLKNMKYTEEFFIPHYLLLLLLSVIGFAMMHFNSVSRLLAGYPFLYIALTNVVLSIKDNGSQRWKKFLIFWMTGFNLFVACCAVNYYMPF